MNELKKMTGSPTTFGPNCRWSEQHVETKALILVFNWKRYKSHSYFTTYYLTPINR